MLGKWFSYDPFQKADSVQGTKFMVERDAKIKCSDYLA